MTKPHSKNCYTTPEVVVMSMCCDMVLMGSNFRSDNESNEAFGEGGRLQDFAW